MITLFTKYPSDAEIRDGPAASNPPILRMPVPGVWHFPGVTDCIDVFLHELEGLLLRLGVGRVGGNEKIELLPEGLVSGISDDRPGGGGVRVNHPAE